jgi:acyl-CoA thioesterase-1
VVIALLSAGCGDTPASRAEPGASDPAGAAGSPAEPRPGRPRIVFLGDSLTAGLGVAAADAYPALIGQRLREAHLDFEVVNVGVSGDTSAGGLRRLDWSLQGDPRVLVLALGANDGLRGLPTAELQRNLSAIIEGAERRRVAVLLAGMEAPPNFGEAYTREFRAVYRDLAAAHRVRFIPFLLDGVAGHPAFNQADGIHPNPPGHRMIADAVWRALEPMLTPAPTS